MTPIEIACFSPLTGRARVKLALRLESGLREYQARYPAISQRIHHYVSPGEVRQWTVITATATPRILSASGSSLDADEAADTFLGELEERAAIAAYTPRRTIIGSARSLQNSGKRIFECSAFLGEPLFPDRWPFASFATEQEYEWAAVESLEDGRETWIPTCLIAGTTGPRFAELTSVGCASARSVDVAAERAFTELCERDGLRISWYLACHPPRLSADSLPSELLDSMTEGWDTTFYHLGVGNNPGVAMAYSRDISSSRFSIGSAFGPADRATFAHAARECIQGRLNAWIQKGVPSPSEIESFDDRMAWYSTVPGRRELDFFFNVGGDGHERSGMQKFTPFRPVPKSGGVLVPVLIEKDRAVVRVVLPECQPLESGHTAARKVRRLLAIAGDAPVRDLPHPFG